MKKSTLITTIAMIVVVVVALSTATYAWFSSAASTFVQTTVSTQADNNLSVTAYDYAIATDTVEQETVYTTNASVVNSESTWTVAQGLWAPTAAISASVAKEASIISLAEANSITGLPYWYTGHKANNAFVKDGEETTNNITGKMLRIANGTNETKNAQVFIVIDLGANPTVKDMYAATAISFFMNNGTDTAMTTGYHHAASSTTALNGATEVQAAGFTKLGTATYSAANLTTSNFVNIGTGSETNGTTITGFNAVPLSTIGNAIHQTNPATSYALVYNTTTAITLTAGQAFNYITFAWIDGWLAEEAVKGSSLNIYFYVAGITAAN